MPFRRILVAIDGSEASDRAFDRALELAELAHAQLTALATDDSAANGAAATRARAHAERAGVDFTIDVRPGHEAEAISQVAAAGAYDLVVLGHHDHLMRDHLLRSTADRVVDHAPCPVMIVR
jgi:nucleotide-binding universal stress UspA family protein